MAVAWVSSTAQGSGTATTTATVTLPTTAADDILILTVINGGANAAPTLTTGTFTLDTSLALIGSGGGWTTGWGGTYWVRCTGNHSGQTIILTGATDSCSMLVQRFSGCITTGNPYDTNISEATVAAGANCALAAFSTTVTDTLVVYAIAVDDNLNTSAMTKGGAAMGNLAVGSSTGGADSHVAMASLAQAGTGTTGAFAATLGAGTNSGKRATAFALKPPIVPQSLPLQVAGAASTTALAPRVPTYLGSAVYAAAVLADTPSLYWRLGEPSGTNANDETANNRDGTYTGTFTLAQSGALKGDGNTAVDLNGTDGRVTSTYNPFVNGTTRTFEGWAYRDNSATEDILFGSSSGFPGAALLQLQSGGNNVFFYSGDFVAIGYGAVWPGNAQWVHWALVFNETTNDAELFINGATVGSGPQTDPYDASPGTFQVGVYATTSDPFDGKIDEVAVYEYGLTAAQILNHYKIGIGRALGPAVAISTTALVLSNPTKLALVPAGATSTTALVLSNPTKLALAASTVQTTTALLVRAPDHLQLAASASTTTTALVLRAPDHLQLAASTATSTTALVLTAPVVDLSQSLPLQPAAAQSTTALVLSNPTLLATAPAAATSTTALALRADDHLQLAPSAAVATTSLSLSNPTKLALAAATATSTTALVLTAPLVTEDADLPLQGAAAGTTTALVLHAPDHLQLAASAATATTALVLKAPNRLALAPSAATATTALVLKAPNHLQFGSADAVTTTSIVLTVPGIAFLVLGTATATSTTALVVRVPNHLQLVASAATSTTALSLSTPAPQSLPLQPAATQSTTALSLHAPDHLQLSASVATATTALALTASTHLALDVSGAVSTTALDLTAPTTVAQFLVLGPSVGVSTTALVLLGGTGRWDPTTDTAWDRAIGEEWNVEADDEWDQESDERWLVTAESEW